MSVSFKSRSNDPAVQKVKRKAHISAGHSTTDRYLWWTNLKCLMHDLHYVPIYSSAVEYESVCCKPNYIRIQTKAISTVKTPKIRKLTKRYWKSVKVRYWKNPYFNRKFYKIFTLMVYISDYLYKQSHTIKTD